ncbi:unnamed protein product [Closterium sp. NIES-54]
MVGSAVEMVGCAVEMVGSAVEMVGSAVEMVGSAVEMVGCAVEMVGCAVEMVGCAVEMVGSAVEMVGSAVEMVGCAVEMVGSAVEMVGCAVEMVGTAVEMMGGRAESKLPCWFMLHVHLIVIHAFPLSPPAYRYPQLSLLSLFPSITPLVFIAPVSSSLPLRCVAPSVSPCISNSHCIALHCDALLPFHFSLPFLTLTLSPGIADIVGRRVGSAKLPWNDQKSWAGSVAMLLFGYGLALFTIHLFTAAGFYSSDWLLLPNLSLRVFLVSLGATVVESLPISDKLDDNLTVPLSTVLFGMLLLQL